MSITDKTRKILWGLSGYQCAFPGCTQSLGRENESVQIIGEECHIEGQGNSGPRHNPDLTSKQVDDYSNLILLCPTHHTIIDKDTLTYTVEKLKEMKSQHEAKVKKALSDLDSLDYDALFYESIVLSLSELLDFQKWDEWTSYLVSNNSSPQLIWGMSSRIDSSIDFINTRNWIDKYPDFKKAILNLKHILIDFNEVFSRHSTPYGDVYRTEKFYYTQPYDRKYADETLPLYRKHCKLITNLVYEITRACNLICDCYRNHIDKGFRMKEGKLHCYEIVPGYRIDEQLYPGLEEFEKIVDTRDYYVKLA